MSKAKMKFPPVPGDTPRERFINLVHHVISIPKDSMGGTERKSSRRKRAKNKETKGSV
jgi:hypothetical protein